MGRRRTTGRPAPDGQRNRWFLKAETGAGDLERERAITDGLRQGLADVQAGWVVSHDQAMAEINAMIEAASRSRRPWPRR
jgi:predicted transcriptional regulator